MHVFLRDGCAPTTRTTKVISVNVIDLYDSRRRWYKKGAHPKGRNVFMRDMEPFIKWLEEAEEDEDDE